MTEATENQETPVYVVIYSPTGVLDSIHSTPQKAIAKVKEMKKTFPALNLNIVVKILDESESTEYQFKLSRELHKLMRKELW